MEERGIEPRLSGGAGGSEADRTGGRLPNFLVIGTTKGGTTSLHHYLAEHPDVYLFPGKEVHYFDVNHHESLAWYRAHFAPAGSQRAVGEKTPEYLADPDAAARMAAVVPTARLIAILRHPVDRAYSHYWMQRAKFPSPETFEELVEAEIRDPNAHPPPPHHRYLQIGRYAEHLRRFDDLMPKAPKLILTMDELESAPETTYVTMCRFLEIDETYVPATLGKVFNPTRALRSARLRRLMLRTRIWKRAPRLATRLDRANRTEGYPPLSDDLRAKLLDYYRPHNQALAERLGRDLSAWDR
ncbi:MAG: sulfotransferase family protein [Actinomycetota bacterium]